MNLEIPRSTKLKPLSRYLQAYLNLAYDKVNMLRQEAGKISNTDLQVVSFLSFTLFNIR